MNPMKVPFFVVLEGDDLTGKSTQIRVLAERLRTLGYDVVTTREPGGTTMAEDIRTVLISPQEEKVYPDTELLLMFAARNQHIQNLILPSLQEGKIVLCDRFIDSSYVYQVALKEASESMFYMLTTMLANEAVPDITYILEVPLEEYHERAVVKDQGHGIHAHDHLSSEKRDLVREVYHSFQIIPNHELINADVSQEDLTEHLLDDILIRYKTKMTSMLDS